MASAPSSATILRPDQHVLVQFLRRQPGNVRGEVFADDGQPHRMTGGDQSGIDLHVGRVALFVAGLQRQRNQGEIRAFPQGLVRLIAIDASRALYPYLKQ